MGSSWAHIEGGIKFGEEIDDSPLKMKTVPMLIFEGKLDSLAIPDLQELYSELHGSNILEYHEVEGGHRVFFSGQDLSWFLDVAVPRIKKYNLAKTKLRNKPTWTVFKNVLEDSYRGKI